MRWTTRVLMLGLVTAAAACGGSPSEDAADAPDIRADDESTAVDGDGGTEAAVDGDAIADVDSGADVAADTGPDVHVETDDAAGPDDAGDAGPGRLVGGFELVEGQAAGRIACAAGMYFQRQPAVPSSCGVETETFGECSVSRTATPTCSPSCGLTHQFCVWNATCDAGVCADPVPILSAGEVTIAGATHQPLVRCALSSTTGAYLCDIDMLADFWEPGDTLRLVAPGDAFPAFEISVPALPPVELANDLSAWTPATLDGSSDIDLAWAAGDSTTRMAIGALNGSDTALVCWTADDGSFSIPAAALRAMDPASGAWNFAIRRYQSVVLRDGLDGEVTGTVGASESVRIPVP